MLIPYPKAPIARKKAVEICLNESDEGPECEYLLLIIHTDNQIQFTLAFVKVKR